MAYNPIYPVFVKFNCSQEIWNMHDIYIWHFLLKSFGTKKTFKYLKYRLEHNQDMVPIFTLLIAVLTISWLITFWMKFSYWKKQFRNQNFAVLLKRFILHVNPNLNNVIEHTPLIRNRQNNGMNQQRQLRNNIVLRRQPTNTGSTNNTGPTNNTRPTSNRTTSIRDTSDGPASNSTNNSNRTES